MGDKSDSRSRKWMITINNPLDKGFTHDKIKEVLTSIRSLDYWAMCDEIGNEKHTLHTHIIIHRGGALRFSTLQKMFPPGSQLDNLRGTMQQARDYICKEGKYKGSNKEETNLKNTHVDALLRQVTSYVYTCNKVWRIMVHEQYDAFELENASDPTLIKPKSRFGWFIRDAAFNAYDTLACVGNLTKSCKEGDMLTEEQILELQRNNPANLDGIVNPSRKLKRASKKLRK